MIDQSKEISQFILAKVQQHPADIVAVATKHFKVTRTTIHRHLSRLLTQNKIIKSGTTRAAVYYLSSALNRSHSYKIQPHLSEFDVYSHHFEAMISGFAKNIQDICHYAFTEIFNNAIDHSHGNMIKVNIALVKQDIVISIQDDGIGVFKSLYNHFALDDIRESVLQLCKGKMTTDPSNHSGEGIFFTSRVMDTFEICANNLSYIRDNTENDWGLQTLPGKMSGSKIVMRINKSNPLTITEVFQQYQDKDTLAFAKTDIIVEMAKWGEETLISRSQAKRIVRDLEKFKHVTLDFKSVRLVGQGFVDEVFRVFARKYPAIKLVYINANSDVEFMIKRGLA